jgi:hypothetical protein
LNAGSTYAWTISGGTILTDADSNAVVVEWLHNGTGSISVKETNTSNCDTTVIQSILINERPVPVIMAITVVCRNTMGHVYATTLNAGSTYAWTISGGTILTDADSNAVVVEWLHNGTGSITVKEKNSLGCDTTVTVNNILINERPVPVIIGDTVVCRNTDGHIYATTLNAGSSYAWTIQRRYTY